MIDTIICLPAGRVRGAAVNGVRSYLSVPYAAPPEGPLRFALPASVPPWDGLRDATVAGALAPQSLPASVPQLNLAPMTGPSWQPGSLDYLTLNLWRPDTDATALPTMIFIHGGGFVAGSKDVPVCDGSTFARQGVVCIAINYRLGVEGFLPIPGVPTNLGLRDQLAALQWVHDNVHLFGGDPANVTIFGESAGAVSISCLLASPLAKGLFHRAILQSGHGLIRREIKVARRVVTKLAKILKISADEEGFCSVGSQAMIEAQERVSGATTRLDLRDDNGIDAFFGISRFSPVYGDDVLPEAPEIALAKGAASEVVLLVGTNAEEMNAFTIMSGMSDKIGRLFATFALRKFFPDARRILKSYGMGRAPVTPGQALTDAANDLVFRTPARLFALAHTGKTHFYEFEWRSPAMGGKLGAAHALELPFVFDTLPLVSGQKGLLGANPPQQLADRIHDLWAEFAKTGDLPWPEFSNEHRSVFLLHRNVAITEPPFAAEDLLARIRPATGDERPSHQLQ